MWSQSPWGFLVGWYSCPNSSISTKPLLKMEYPADSITQQMIMGREGKNIANLQGFHHLDDRAHPLFFFFCFFPLSLFHFIFLALKRLTLIRPHDLTSQDVTLNRSWPGQTCACLAGHSHHIVGLGGTGSAQHHQFLLAADVTVHHGAHCPAAS